MPEYQPCQEPGCETKTTVRYCHDHTPCIEEGCTRLAFREGVRCPECGRLRSNAMKRQRVADQRADLRARGLTTKGTTRPFNRPTSPPAPVRVPGDGVATFAMAQMAIAQAAQATPEPSPPCVSGLQDHHWLIESPNGPTSVGVCRLCGHKREDFLNSGPLMWEDSKSGTFV
jgi:hypothetical protein